MSSLAAPPHPSTAAHTLAAHVAALLPPRAGTPWTVDTTRTGAKNSALLVNGRRSLVLVVHEDRTDAAWKTAFRHPVAEDVNINGTDPEVIAGHLLRLVLPVMDDEIARYRQIMSVDDRTQRTALAAEIGAAMRAQGAATYERPGLLPNTSSVVWSSSGLRYSATLYGANAFVDVQISGPLRAVEQAVTRFLPPANLGRPVIPAGIRGRLERRIAQVLAARVPVEQLDGRGLTFGAWPSPYGYVAASPDPAAKAHDTTPASVDIQNVGVDALVSLAPYLAR